MEKLIPSPEFCKRCKNKDIRKLQDFNNNLIFLIDKIASVLEIDDDIFGKIRKIDKWANEEIRKRNMIELPKKKKYKKKLKGVNYNESNSL